MGIDVEELIIQPFREVVERGNEAIVNAAACDHDDDDDAASSELMLKSARALVKEGERALHKLTPLWQSQVDKHGDAFKEALRYNDSILESQRHLEDLLYDLDDFVQVDSFDSDRFAQVQAASKTYALTLLETVKRMRIDDPSLWPFSPHAPSMSTPSDRSVPQLPPPKQHRSNSDRAPFPGFGPTSYQDSVGTASRKPSSLDILGAERDCINLVPEPDHSTPAGPRPAAQGSRISAWVREQTNGTGFWPTHNTIPECDPYIGHVDNNRDSRTMEGTGWPCAEAAQRPVQPRYRVQQIRPRLRAPGSFDSGHRSSSNIPTSDQRTTSLAWPLARPTSQEYIEDPTMFPPPFQPNPESQRDPALAYEDGLIPIDELLVRHRSLTSGYQVSLKSSFYLQKGFCAGAEKYRTKGTKAATKSVMEYGSRRSIARCVDCEYAQSMLEVELDTQRCENSSANVSKLMLQTRLPISGNLSKAGVLYRLRFLYKSHMISTTAFMMQYGCMFCAQKGYTVYADDATIFASEDQLFQHLARHPQPLPEIPGVTVLYGELEDDDPQKDDYDLHFLHPPVPSPLPDATSLALLPTAVATKNHIKRYGRELEDPDGGATDVLKFFEGARIVGIEFPEKWKGRWCTGWHDGTWGSFPVKLVVLEAPAHLPGSTPGAGMMVTTRWKWDGRDPSTGWLPLEKEETIFNVCWLNQDDWCWSGRKKDGRFGLFPRSHVKVETLRDETDFQDDEVDSLEKKTKKLSFGLHGLSSVRLSRRMTIGSHTS